MKLMIINGSPRENSRSRGMTTFVEKKFQEAGIDSYTFDARINELPLYKGGHEQEHDEVKKLRELAKEADGFFITTPEYHNGMSGALKNALDFLGGDHFRNKPIAIAASSGGGKGGINALNNLRTVMRGLYGLVLPNQIVVDPNHFNEDLELVDEMAQNRVTTMVNELLVITEKLSGDDQINS